MQSRLPVSETELADRGGWEWLLGCRPFSPAEPENRKWRARAKSHMCHQPANPHTSVPHPHPRFVPETRNRHTPLSLIWAPPFLSHSHQNTTSSNLGSKDTILTVSGKCCTSSYSSPRCLAQPTSPILPDPWEKQGLQFHSLLFTPVCPPPKVASH